jgi:hypothetical protein
MLHHNGMEAVKKALTIRQSTAQAFAAQAKRNAPLREAAAH